VRDNKFRGNVFVANLPNGWSDAQLGEMFDTYGLVLGAALARDPSTGTAKGHGLVSLAPERAAAKAIAALNGSTVGGRPIVVKKADPNLALNLAPRRPETPLRPGVAARPMGAAPARVPPQPIIVIRRSRAIPGIR
jgi:RNA recognition motif-containing protein